MHQVVDVAVIRHPVNWVALTLIFHISAISAAVLPDDRADLLFHEYDGGGVEISGPSLLVRKKFRESFSVSANHYVDNISSASVDVITTASPYTEKRTENSVGLDYLHDKTVMSLAYTDSTENDFDAKTINLNISQNMFADLTTISMGYAEGDNIITRYNDDNFKALADSKSYRLSLSQIMTKDLIMALSMEIITDQGYLNNPYRQVRYLDDSDSRGYSYQAEVYPNTRTSNAIALRARYYLPKRAALHGEYRFFTDTWGIGANTLGLGYVRPYEKEWILDFSYRFHDQNSADFYSDLFPFGGDDNPAQNHLARDKELSTFTSQTLGIGASRELIKNGAGFIKRSTLNLNIDYIDFDYKDFRDLRVSTEIPGEEPLYNFQATVIRFFISVWF